MTDKLFEATVDVFEAITDIYFFLQLKLDNLKLLWHNHAVIRSIVGDLLVAKNSIQNNFASAK